MWKRLTSIREVELGTVKRRDVNKLTFPARTEVVARVAVHAGLAVREGLTARAEPVPGLYMAESLVKVTDGSTLTSFANTTEEEIELIDFVATLEASVDYETSETTVEIGYCTQGGSLNLSRGERVVAKLRDEHLNGEERKFLRAICFDYADVFYLPGDKLSCTNAAKHTIQLEPGVTPINTRPYRLPESQEEEIGRQVGVGGRRHYCP